MYLFTEYASKKCYKEKNKYYERGTKTEFHIPFKCKQKIYQTSPFHDM